MKTVVTSKQMKELEHFTIEQVGVSSLVLMEKAALFVCEQIKKEHSTVLVFCSHGNNGADGLAVARLLKEREHIVSVIYCGEKEKATRENILQYDALKESGVPVFSLEEFRENYDNNAMSVDYVVDALFGIGLNRALEGIFLDAVKFMNHIKNTGVTTIISVDCPSGLHCDTGCVLGDAVKADITATFQVEKTGFYLMEGPTLCGDVRLGNIGITLTPAKLDGESSSRETFFEALEDSDLKHLIPVREKSGNKGSFGKLLSIIGSEGMAGAMLLGTESAFRSGIGMVRVISHGLNRLPLMLYTPEAIFDEYSSVIDHHNIIEDRMKAYFEWSKALLIGSGLSNHDTAVCLVEYAMGNYHGPMIVDGDAINIISNRMELLEERAAKGYITILTPHPVEFARLIGKDVKERKNQDIEFCREFAKKNRCILVAKDASTIITNGNQVYLHRGHNDALACAGSGDVLAGIIAAFVCQRVTEDVDLTALAALGVWTHGKCGEYAARKRNHRSVKAGDLPEEISKVFEEGGL